MRDPVRQRFYFPGLVFWCKASKAMGRAQEPGAVKVSLIQTAILLRPFVSILIDLEYVYFSEVTDVVYL